MNTRNPLTAGRILLVAILAAAGLMTAIAAQNEGTAPTAPKKIRIGTYQSRLVALAWGRSAEHNRLSSALYEEGKKAEAAKDSKRLAELKTQGRAGQDLAHAQVFGTAPIPDIIKRIADRLPAVAAQTGVELIAADVAYAGPDVEVVDVSDAIAELFSPDEKTRTMLRQIGQAPALPLKVDVND